MSPYKIADDFVFMEDDTVQTTPENHPHILKTDLDGSCKDCKATIDALRAKCGHSIIGTRISFQIGADGRHQFGQFSFIDDKLVTLARTKYERRSGGVSTGCNEINDGINRNVECVLLGYARALLRFIEEHPESLY